MKTIDLIKPDVYRDFQCKGTACRRTCCAGWRITVSKSEYQDLKDKLNQAGAKILQRMPAEKRSTRVYGEFVLEDQKGCPMQSDEGLCGLQLSFGPEALSDVCAFFPRKALRCGDEMQLSLTPACERVLELLMEKEGPLGFVRCKEPLPPIPAMQVSEKQKKSLWKPYIRLQEFCILLLQAEEVSLDHRMVLLGLGLHEIDSYDKNKEYHKVSGYIDRYLSMLSRTEDIRSLFSSESFSPILLLGSLLTSSANSQGYREIMDQIKEELEVTSEIQLKEGDAVDSYTAEVIYSCSLKSYEQRRKRFQRFTEGHPHFLENVMVMLFIMNSWGMRQTSYSIWEQYMYACWVYSNLKFVLTACIKEDTTEEELLDICVVLFRSWIHNEDVKKNTVKQLHETGSDTPAHMAMLVQAG